MKIIEISPRENDDLYKLEKELRFRILRKPLGGVYLNCNAEECEWFPFELESYHFICLNESETKLIGCVLFHPNKSSGRLFQMAVSEQYQKQGIGRSLVLYLEEKLRERGIQEVTLHARHYSVGFYSRLGYSVYDAPFEEVGILHYHMRKEICSSR
eukprot:Sdes_comp19829_c0_seq1m12023